MRVLPVVLAAGLLLTGCGSDDAEDAYLEHLDDAGLLQFFDDEEDAVEAGEAACTLRENGVGSPVIVAGAEERGMSEAEGRRVYEAAVTAFCPGVL